MVLQTVGLNVKDSSIKFVFDLRFSGWYQYKLDLVPTD